MFIKYNKFMENFISNENKALLWSILYEQGIFNNIASLELQNVKNIFESQINDTCKKIKNDNLNLVDINKIAIKDLSESISKFKLRYEANPAKFINPKNVSNTIIREEKQDKFNKILKEKQNEFTNLIQLSKPETPSFSEDKDEPFDKNNMEMLLNDMMNSREKELNQVMNNSYNNSDNNSDTAILNIGPDINNEININDIYSMELDDKKNEKRVSFEIDSDNKQLNKNISFKNTFIDKLKKISNITENEYYAERLLNESSQENLSIIDKLNKIESNQNKLLELFNVINNKQNSILERFNNLEKNI